jgi:hypothetical protein
MRFSLPLGLLPTRGISPEVPMNDKWFSRIGWFYAPVSIPGAIVCVLAALFCATVFVAVDRHSHSVSDTLYGIFPFFVCTFLLVDWVGSRTSGTSRPAAD